MSRVLHTIITSIFSIIGVESMRWCYVRLWTTLWRSWTYQKSSSSWILHWFDIFYWFKFSFLNDKLNGSISVFLSLTMELGMHSKSKTIGVSMMMIFVSTTILKKHTSGMELSYGMYKTWWYCSWHLGIHKWMFFISFLLFMCK